MIELLDELGYPTDAATFAARYERLREDPATWIFVAERDRRIVGFASLHVSGEWRQEAHAFYVSAGFQDASRRFMKPLE